MGGLIRDDAIRTIRERASLVEVVSDAVTLRKRGRSFVGLCPFHTEKTPSFTVSEERGFFHCFGCGEHGDVFGFVMKTQGEAFPDAVRQVAQRFGLPVPETAAASRDRSEPLVAVTAAAAEFFRTTLVGSAGASARAYLEERGLAADVTERFALGYAPASGDALARHLRSRGLATEDALAVGLLVRRAGGGTIDRFRDRIVFPIGDARGRVVAFGGRVIPSHRPPPDAPKYVNSPESPLFHKGQTLYGLALAREAIRRDGRVVVVEGYMDVIALAQAGFAAVVAPLGTALTADQLRHLRRLTDSVFACFDGDAAGRRAAARSFPVFLEAGLWGRGVFLPAGSDPDSFVRAHGLAAFDACLAAAAPLVDAFLADLAGSDPAAVGRRAQAATEVARLLRRVRNPFEYDVLARMAAQRLGVREEALRAEGAQAASTAKPAEAPSAIPRGAEALLVELMAADPVVASRVRAENVIPEFEHPTWRRAAEVLTAADELDPVTVVDALPPELRDRVARRLLGEFLDEDRERAIADCLASIRSRPARRLQSRLREELRAAEARGDVAAAQAAMQQLRDLTEKART
jgi:DNA primase